MGDGPAPLIRVTGNCTGVTASWCPDHGNCTCPSDETGNRDWIDLDDGSCPLHASDSPHGESLAVLLRAIADEETGPTFMGWPDRWWDAHTVRCLYGHVSTRTLKSTPLLRNVCIACHGSKGRAEHHDWALHLTFPEDHDGPLRIPGRDGRFPAARTGP